MRTLCYSVRLESLVRISDKAFKATAFDGSSDIIPASQVFGRILEKKSIQYSGKKQAWFDENGQMMPTYTIERHTPEKKEAVKSNEINDLKR